MSFVLLPNLKITAHVVGSSDLFAGEADFSDSFEFAESWPNTLDTPDLSPTASFVTADLTDSFEFAESWPNTLDTPDLSPTASFVTADFEDGFEGSEDWPNAFPITYTETVITSSGDAVDGGSQDQYGYSVDGKASNPVVSDETPISTSGIDDDTRAGKSGTTRAFWHMVLASFCHMMVISALITHVMPYLTSIGITRSSASLAAGALPLASISGRLGSGWLGDRFDKRKVTAVSFALLSLGLLLFGALSTGWMWLFIPFIVFFSTGWGSSVTMRSALLREYYPRSKFGRMYGFLAGLTMLGAVAGAPLAGWVFDRWGTYQGIWYVFAGLAVVTIVIVLTIPDVRKKSD